MIMMIISRSSGSSSSNRSRSSSRCVVDLRPCPQTGPFSQGKRLQITKAKVHWKKPLKVYWKIPVEIHWTSDIPLENTPRY